jgi:hypothetical protein
MGAGMISPEPAAVEQTAHARMHVDPDPELVTVYETLFEVYREADAALHSISARLYDFERTYSSGRSE